MDNNLRSHKLKISRHTLTDYFNNIDTQEKAYYLGLLHADGSLGRRMKGNYEEISISISLQEKDKEILEQFCLAVGLSKERVRIFHSGRPNEQRSAQVYICQKNFTKDLVDLKNSKIFEKIPSELTRHFVRGFFDGDGSVFVRRNSKRVFYWAISFCCYGPITDYLVKNLPVTIKPSRDKRSEDLYAVTTNKKENLVSLFNYMYEDSKIHLERKYIKCLEMLKFASTTIPGRGVGTSVPKQKIS